MSDRTTAIHEAGHAAMAVILGATRHAGPVSIDPTDSYGGVCYPGGVARPPRPEDMGRLGAPLPLLPSRLRRHLESSVMFLLAGEAAVDLYAPRGGAPQPALPVPEPLPKEGEVPLFPLPDRETRLLERAAAAADPQSDLAGAVEILRCLHCGDSLLADTGLLMWQHETEAVLAGRQARRMVVALSEELLVYGTLPASRWIRVCRAAL